MEATPEELAGLDASGLFNYLWGSKYGPGVAERLMAERSMKDEAFVDTTWTVAGEELRLMTPRDLLLLDGFESPFVRIGAGLPDEEDCAFFLWTLSVLNTGNGIRRAFRRGRCYGRVTGKDVAEVVAEIEEYSDRVFIEVDRDPDKPKEERRPSSVSFMAELLVGVASEIGARDPMSGELLADTPIPRLLQYQRAAMRREDGGKSDATAFDSARSKCLEEVNIILAERRKKR